MILPLENYLSVNLTITVKLNPEKAEVMLVMNAEILKGILLPTFDWVQLTLMALVKILEIILDPTLLVEKKAAKQAFFELSLGLI